MLLTISIDSKPNSIDSKPKRDQVQRLLDRIEKGPGRSGTEGKYSEGAKLVRGIVDDPAFHLYIVLETKEILATAYGESVDKNGTIKPDVKDKEKAYYTTGESGERVQGKGCRSAVMYFDPSGDEKLPTLVTKWGQDVLTGEAKSGESGPLDWMIHELLHVEDGRQGTAETDDRTDLEHAKMLDRENAIRREHRNEGLLKKIPQTMGEWEEYKKLKGEKSGNEGAKEDGEKRN